MARNYTEVWCNFFENGQPDIKSKAARLSRWLTELIVENDFAGINEMYAATKNTRYSAQSYLEEISENGEEKEKVVCAGYIYALIDLMQQYIEKLSTENEIYKVKTQYRDSVLYIIAKKGNILHKDLAAALGVSPSALTAIIKLINGTSVRLINVNEVSKYKIYSLTPAAFQYVMKNHGNDYFPEQKGTGRISGTFPKATDFEWRESAKSYLTIQNENSWLDQQTVVHLTSALKKERNKVVGIEGARRKFKSQQDSIKMLAVGGK